MVKAKQKFHYLSDGALDLDSWFISVQTSHGLKDIDLLKRASTFSQQLANGLTTFYGRPCIEQGLEIAEILLSLKLDQETASAGILCGALTLSPPQEDIIRKELGEQVTKLIAGIRKTELITSLQKQKTGNQVQMDRIRKMLLAMATDIRVVMIKLAERLSFMRGIKSIPLDDRKRYAQEIFDIYAPLANRLGIGQIKWELEDLAFHYQHPDTYKKIAGFLAERRADREARIQHLIEQLKTKLNESHINGQVTGRAKHIYSIYLKMNRKELDQMNIFDHSALRILVPTVEDCYTALGIVNSLWPPIQSEFDDYIANPKPNGYRSIHTAIIGEDGKHFEIQIRTQDMHEEAERGVAAHWLYKEGNKNSPVDDRTKISYLRQLIDWHREVAIDDSAEKQIAAEMDSQIYVITPAGDIMDLPQGATPIDFAYHIHSEVGHRCRGAKINGHIVPLTYALKTGDKVDIHTIPEGSPSRDWLNAELGFIKTGRARSKISHWFKQQELNQDIAEGRNILDKELARSGLAKSTSLIDIARHFHLKNEDELLAGLGRGNIRIGQILHAIQPKAPEKPSAAYTPPATQKASRQPTGSALSGASEFLTRYAKCCKPIPGDLIIGYITQTSGISIHKRSCSNIRNLSNPNRYIPITWDKERTNAFVTELKILTEDQNKVLHDMTALFVNEKIKLLSFNSNIKRDHGKIVILATLEVYSMDQLNHIKHRIANLPGVIDVMRVK